MKSVEVNQLVKNFKKFTAVNDLSFSIDQAEVFGLLGPNGAGKTTTIRMLCGILKPSSGTGHVAGFNILSETEKIKAHIGYMSQKFSLYPDLTVAENIAFFSSIYRIDRRTLTAMKDWALKMAGLTDLTRRLTRDLPGGYKQRLALVCALMHSPSVLFLDEPTAGIDPIARRDFWNLIYSLKMEKGTTVFVTTHYMDEAEHCERIALIQEGSISAIGSPGDLKKQLREKVILVQGEPFFDMKTFFERDPAVRRTIPYGRSLHLLLKRESDIPVLRTRMEKTTLRISRFEMIEPSLEDVFISATAD